MFWGVVRFSDRGNVEDIISNPEEIRKANLAYYTSHKSKVTSEIRKHIDKGAYSEALRISQPYLESNDKDLLALKNEAQENQLREKVARIPASEWEKNRDLYAQLVSLNPDKALYRKKHDYYQRKFEGVGKEPIGGFGIAPPEVKLYLQGVAHDPDSIEIDVCSTPALNPQKTGWLVGCNYRGRNGFGGMVRKANWFTIQRNRVVKVEPGNAYSLKP